MLSKIIMVINPLLIVIIKLIMIILIITPAGGVAPRPRTVTQTVELVKNHPPLSRPFPLTGWQRH